MQRHVHVACKMDHEGKRLQPDVIGQAFVGEQTLAALDLGGHAVAARTVAARIVVLAHRRGAVMPCGGIAPAPAGAPHAIGPHARVLDGLQLAFRRGQQRRCLEQLLHPGARVRIDIGIGDLRRRAMREEAPRLHLGRKQRGKHGQRRDDQLHATVSYCSITHSSSSEAVIQACIHSCSHSASMYAAAKPGTGTS